MLHRRLYPHFINLDLFRDASDDSLRFCLLYYLFIHPDSFWETSDDDLEVLLIELPRADVLVAFLNEKVVLIFCEEGTGIVQGIIQWDIGFG